MSKKTILFIVSHAHSGSTLLDKTIGCHSDCFSLGEIIFFSKIFREKKEYCGCEQPYTNCPFWEKIIERINLNYHIDFRKNPDLFDLNFSAIDRTNSSSTIISYAKYLSFLLGLRKYQENKTIIEHTHFFYQSVFEETNAQVLIDSSKNLPRALILAKNLKQYQFKYIFLIRDGRSVLNSFQRKTSTIYIHNRTTGEQEKISKPKDYFPLEQIIAGWKRSNMSMHYNFKYFVPKKDFQLVRYEDFTAHPDSVLPSICDLLELPYEEKMKNIGAFQNHIIGGHYSRVNAKEILQPKASWRQNLSPELLEAFNTKAGSTNSFFGYN